MGETMTRPGDCRELGGDCMSTSSLMERSNAGGVWCGTPAFGDTTTGAAGKTATSEAPRMVST